MGLKCEICRAPILDDQKKVALATGGEAHAGCANAKPFRETTSLADRADESRPLKERELRE